MPVKSLATDLLRRKVRWWWFRGCVAVIFVVSGFGLLFSWQQAAELVRAVHNYHYTTILMLLVMLMLLVVVPCFVCCHKVVEVVVVIYI